MINKKQKLKIWNNEHYQSESRVAICDLKEIHQIIDKLLALHNRQDFCLVTFTYRYFYIKPYTILFIEVFMVRCCDKMGSLD